MPAHLEFRQAVRRSFVVVSSQGRGQTEPMRLLIPCPLLVPFCACVLLAGCSLDLEPCGIGGQPGLIDGRLGNPYPSMHLMSGGSDCSVEIPEGTFDLGDSGPFDYRPLQRRDGFSPAGTIVWAPGVALDSTSLVGPGGFGASLAVDASIEVWDLEDGTRLPYFAEVDAFPEQSDEDRVLLIRPLSSLGFGTHVGVVVRSNLRQAGGAPVPIPEAFVEVLEGKREGLDPSVFLHYSSLLARVNEVSQSPFDVHFAWDFRVGSRENIVAPLDRVIGAMREALPVDSTFEPQVDITSVLDSGQGDAPAGDLWREVRGSVQLPHFLWDAEGKETPTEDDHDGGWFQLDSEGLPRVRGGAPAYFTLVVPQSLAGASAGSAPVVIFGHGIFANPQLYLASPNDENSTMELCDRLGAICIGTEWRGLTLRDSPDALRAALDLSRFPLVTDKLHQGVANQLAMARLMKTAFTQSPFLEAADGSGSLIDPSRIYYFGISLGGIEGATFLANSEVIESGVLHVPGSMWTTMLERSVNWVEFEQFVVEVQPVPSERQFFYAGLQMLWDPVDPLNHATELSDRNVLWQVSRGDEQVPNFTAEALVRSAGAPLLEPVIWDVEGLERVETDSGTGQSGLFQWDSGIDAPSDVNRPHPEETGAHTSIRHLDEVMTQVEAYFNPNSEGQVVSPCGGPCVFSLEGEE